MKCKVMTDKEFQKEVDEVAEIIAHEFNKRVGIRYCGFTLFVAVCSEKLTSSSVVTTAPRESTAKILKHIVEELESDSGKKSVTPVLLPREDIAH